MKLDRDLGRSLLKEMVRIRRFEEKCAEVYSAGKIRGFLHLYIGEEAVAAGAMRAFGPEDAILATYREHGHALVRGIAAGAVMAEMYGKVEGCSRGRGGSMHIFDAATRFYGEGAVAEGEFHESLNLASLWKVPALFLCENNLYAMGTALERSEADTDLCEKARSYKMPARSVDGMDVMAVKDATAQAAAEVRAGGGPQFLEFRTYRFRAHSMFDAELYRTKAEVEQWKPRCPILTFTNRLKAGDMIDDAALAAIEAEVADEIARAVAFAEAGSWEPVENLARDVYTGRAA
jgi:pyruvate dehydrogenase E1 component alpha subunit